MLGGEHRRQPVGNLAALFAHPESIRDGGGNQGGVRSALRSTNQAPSGNASSRSAATCKARRVLPTPPGPVIVSRRTSSPSQQLNNLSDLIFATDERGLLQRQVIGARGKGPERGELGR